MPNMSKIKVDIQEQPKEERIHNFKEVTHTYTLEQAKEEAERCLNCKAKPCAAGCPVNTNIPDFIQQVKIGDIKKAYEVIQRSNNYPAICGRVCPQETQCEGRCVRGKNGEPVGIGRLERFVADEMMKEELESTNIEKNGIKVAVIGGGPAGLACAADLAKRGYEVTIFEALHMVGGVLMYGIPEFRLPKDIVRKEIEKLKGLGVKIEKNVLVGRSITIDELLEEGFKAIFVGSGAGLPNAMGIPGENLNGVYYANEFLTRVNLMKAYDFPNYPTPVKVGKKVVVVGAGNVAMDAARTAKRLGAEEVYIIYRRSEEEMPARKEEIHHAEQEGVIIKVLTNPITILEKEGFVSGVECVKMELGEPDEKGRRRPVEIKNSEFTIEEVNTVVVAIGQAPNPLIKKTTEDLQVQKWGGIIVNEETMETTKENVYAGGDAVTGGATVIIAMGAGLKAAKAIDEKLKNIKK